MQAQQNSPLIKVQATLSSISKWVSHVGMAMAVLMMLMVVVDVIMRFTLNKPILGSVELASYMLSIIAFTAIPYVESEEMHIVIPLVFDRFPKKVRLIVNTLVGLLGFAMLVLISVASYLLTAEYLHRGKVTQVLSIPIYPFVFIAAFCLSLYAIMLIVNAINYIYLNR